MTTPFLRAGILSVLCTLAAANQAVAQVGFLGNGMTGSSGVAVYVTVTNGANSEYTIHSIETDAAGVVTAHTSTTYDAEGNERLEFEGTEGKLLGDVVADLDGDGPNEPDTDSKGGAYGDPLGCYSFACDSESSDPYSTVYSASFYGG